MEEEDRCEVHRGQINIKESEEVMDRQRDRGERGQSSREATTASSRLQKGTFKRRVLSRHFILQPTLDFSDLFIFLSGERRPTLSLGSISKEIQWFLNSCVALIVSLDFALHFR